MGLVVLSSPAESLSGSSTIYPTAVVLVTLSLIVLLLIIAPFFWHFRNRNIGATFFVGWVIILLFFNIVNAILWGSDNTEDWYNGVGLCDVEVKLQIASEVGLPAAFACVLRALATVMDTSRATMRQSEAQRRRQTLIEVFICVFFPLLEMVLQYIVQPNRYYILGIAGCTPSSSNSWVATVLVLVPPGLWLLLDMYLAILILIRLCRYRANFSAIVASSSTSKSRFLRLYLICIVWITISLVVWIYEFWWNSQSPAVPFSWSSIHNPQTWNSVLEIPSGGTVFYDRWLHLTAGILVFLFFGFGREAKNMYLSGLSAIGFGKVFPSLNRRGDTGARRQPGAGSSANMGLLAKLKSFMSTTTGDSHATVQSNTPSPRKWSYGVSIDEAPDSHLARCYRGDSHTESTMSRNPSFVAHLRTAFANSHNHTNMLEDLDQSRLSRIPVVETTVRSDISGGSRTPEGEKIGDASRDVVVRKDVTLHLSGVDEKYDEDYEI